MQFIRTILIILLVYYGMKFIARLLAPLLLKKILKKMSGYFQNSSYYHTYHTREQENEGDISIKKSRDQKVIKSNKIGDYVDFEEVNE